MPAIMISCGEPSGDLYAGALAKEILRLDPGSRVFGLGGEHLRAAGATLVGEYRGLTVAGLVEVVKMFPRNWRMYRRMLRLGAEERPDVFVAIDYPDFNLLLARGMNRIGVPVVYYVSPQIWAWRPGRLKTLRRVVETMLVIFPFEEEIYRRGKVPVQFVGHPLLDLARATEPRPLFLEALGLRVDAPTVALLPGSRPNEVREILPGLAKASALIAARVPGVQFLLARAPHLDASLLAPVQGPGLPQIAIVEGRTDDVLGACDVVLTASGTATVQTAIHERPMVIVYRVAPLTYMLGKPFLRVDTYGMVNLVAGRRIMPELIQEDFTPEAVAREAVGFLCDEARASEARTALREMKRRLGSSGASERAAQAILEVASARRSGAPR